MAETVKSYEDLDVWRSGIELTLRVYDLVQKLPRSERYELSAQMRRCAVSIPSNVAEGHARRVPKPFLNHVHISLGSLAELVTCLVIASRLKFISETDLEAEIRETTRIGQMLHGLARSLERRIEQKLAVRLGLLVGSLAGLLGVLG